MKIFGINIGGKQTLAATPKSTMGAQAFSTPFLTVGEGNLALPYVDRYYTVNNIIRFGSDNLYPQLLNQMYYTSPIHGTAIDFITNAIIGGGYYWKDEKLPAADRVDLMAFEKANRLSKLAKTLTRDWIMHRRVCVVVTRRGNKAVKLTRLDPATIRNNADLESFIYSVDWSRGMVNTVTYPRYYEGCAHVESLYVYQDDSPGQDIYPIPSYNSILNWAYLDGEQSFFHKSHIQNSIFPSLAIRRPKEFGSIEEVQQFKHEIQSKTGASNAGRVIVLTGNGMDDVPEIVSVDVKSNDNVFDSTSREIKDQICFAHGINPSIMGIKVAGSLGATTELQDSYAILEKNRIMPERYEMECILNDLVHAANITNHLLISDFQIIDKAIVEVTDTKIIDKP